MVYGVTLAGGARIYWTYLPTQLTQNALNVHKNFIKYRRKPGNNHAILRLIVPNLAVEILDDL